jgi:outer membrane lipoprotein LolB
MKRAVLMLAALLALAGCASRETVFRPESVAAAADSPFQVSGRLSIRVDGKGQMAGFDWQHALARDELSVNTPLGSTVARLTRDETGVTLESDGKIWHAPDVEALTERRLGWPLPLGNLVWWIRGRPAPGEPAVIDADGSLLQQGWRIRFTSDADHPSAYPSRVDLDRDNLSIRIVTNHWQ